MHQDDRQWSSSGTPTSAAVLLGIHQGAYVHVWLLEPTCLPLSISVLTYCDSVLLGIYIKVCMCMCGCSSPRACLSLSLS